MTTVLDVLENFSKLDIDREVKVSIAKTSKQMADLNREQLLNGDTARTGKMPDYSPISVSVYGKPAGPIRLYDTGAFHASIQVDVGGDSLEFIADDRYNLLERYGEDNVLGLNNTQQEYYNNEIFYPEFRAKIEDATGL